jgi:hypothetical protein
LERIKFVNAAMDITQDVADQLVAASVPLSSIHSIIWSHHHMDHNGDPSLWPKSTSLVVGPGFKSNPHTYPGFPNNPDSVVCQDALEGRDLVELEFGDTLEIGGFKAVDFFGDGSFYLLQASGHSRYPSPFITALVITVLIAHDHICGLARTSANKFIFMGGDTAHHGGEFRPTRFLPLPEYITPSPFEAPNSRGVCPGAFFEPIHPSSVTSSGNYRTTPFYELSPMMNDFLPDAQATVSKMQLFDASPDVFVVIAHDASLLDILPFYPKGELTGWEKTGDKIVGRWRFLKDFCKAVELLKVGVPEL